MQGPNNRRRPEELARSPRCGSKNFVKEIPLLLTSVAIPHCVHCFFLLTSTSYQHGNVLVAEILVEKDEGCKKNKVCYALLLSEAQVAAGSNWKLQMRNELYVWPEGKAGGTGASVAVVSSSHGHLNRLVPVSSRSFWCPLSPSRDWRARSHGPWEIVLP